MTIGIHSPNKTTVNMASRTHPCHDRRRCSLPAIRIFLGTQYNSSTSGGAAEADSRSLHEVIATNCINSAQKP